MANHATTPLVLTRAAVREVDRIAIAELGIPGVVLMENAAIGLARIALEMLPRGGKSLIVCGSGNNGGDGYAAARHLHNAGAAVRLVALGCPREGSDAAVNAQICQNMKLPIAGPEALDEAAASDLIIDAIFGTGLDRVPDGVEARAIGAMNASRRPILAADIPSGLEADSGRPLDPAACVKAARTATFVALKPGFLSKESREWTGPVDVVDIGVPQELVQRLAQMK